MFGAVALAAARLAASNRRSFARHRTITARALRECRGAASEPDIEVRPLERYDALIA